MPPASPRPTGGASGWRILAITLAAAILMAAAGGGGYLIASRASSGSPAGGTGASTPSGSSIPAAGEPPIQPASDCSGGSSLDSYLAAAVRDICQVLIPIAAMDPACTNDPGAVCRRAASRLTQVAEAALQDIQGRKPVTAAERAAGPHLTAAFRDYANAGAEIAAGVATGSRALEDQGLALETAGTDALSAAGVDLSG
jgi:hypothetical protein